MYKKERKCFVIIVEILLRLRFIVTPKWPLELEVLRDFTDSRQSFWNYKGLTFVKFETNSPKRHLSKLQIPHHYDMLKIFNSLHRSTISFQHTKFYIIEVAWYILHHEHWSPLHIGFLFAITASNCATFNSLFKYILLLAIHFKRERACSKCVLVIRLHDKWW